MQTDETNPLGQEVAQPEAPNGGDNPPAVAPSGDAPEKDPLDEITDPDALRSEAKKYRGIAGRKSKPVNPAPSAEAPAPSAPAPAAAPLTQRDLHRINSTKARKMLRENPEMAPHAEEIEKLYANRRGLEDPDEIFEDLKDAFTVFQARNGSAQAPTGAEDLTKVPAPAPSSAKPPVKEGRQTQPLRQKPQPMSSWYPKKEA